MASDIGIEIVLLPVEPPEIDAHVFVRTVSELEKLLHVIAVRQVEERHIVAGMAESLDKLFIIMFVRAYAVVRMVVERDGDAAAVTFGYQRGRVFDQVVVPGIAVPVEMAVVACTRRGVVGVPRHVEDDIVDGKIVFVVTVDDVEEFFVGIIPVAAVPDAVDIFTCHRHTSADGSEACESRAVVIAVYKAVLILDVAVGVAGLEPAVDEEVRAFVVDDIPSVAAEKAVLHRNLFFDAVEGLYRAAEVFGEYEAVGKRALFAVKHVFRLEI